MSKFSDGKFNIGSVEVNGGPTNFDVRELAADKITDGAGISEVGAAARENFAKKYFLEIMFGSIFVIISICSVILAFCLLKRKNKAKNLVQSENLPIPDAFSIDQVNSLNLDAKITGASIQDLEHGQINEDNLRHRIVGLNGQINFLLVQFEQFNERQNKLKLAIKLIDVNAIFLNNHDIEDDTKSLCDEIKNIAIMKMDSDEARKAAADLARADRDERYLDHNDLAPSYVLQAVLNSAEECFSAFEEKLEKIESNIWRAKSNFMATEKHIMMLNREFSYCFGQSVYFLQQIELVQASCTELSKNELGEAALSDLKLKITALKTKALKAKAEVTRNNKFDAALRNNSREIAETQQFLRQFEEKYFACRRLLKSAKYNCAESLKFSVCKFPDSINDIVGRKMSEFEFVPSAFDKITNFFGRLEAEERADKELKEKNRSLLQQETIAIKKSFREKRCKETVCSAQADYNAENAENAKDAVNAVIKAANEAYEQRLNVAKLLDDAESKLCAGEDAHESCVKYATLRKNADELMISLKADIEKINNLLKTIDVMLNVKEFANDKDVVDVLWWKLNSTYTSLCSRIDKFNALEAAIENVTDALQARVKAEAFLDVINVRQQIKKIFNDDFWACKFFCDPKNELIKIEFERLEEKYAKEISKNLQISEFEAFEIGRAFNNSGEIEKFEFNGIFRFNDVGAYAKRLTDFGDTIEKMSNYLKSDDFKLNCLPEINTNLSKLLALSERVTETQMVANLYWENKLRPHLFVKKMFSCLDEKIIPQPVCEDIKQILSTVFTGESRKRIDAVDDIIKVANEAHEQLLSITKLVDVIAEDKRAIDKLSNQIDIILSVKRLVDNKEVLAALYTELELQKESLGKHVSELNKFGLIRKFLVAINVERQGKEIFGDFANLNSFLEQVAAVSTEKEYKGLKRKYTETVRNLELNFAPYDRPVGVDAERRCVDFFDEAVAVTTTNCLLKIDGNLNKLQKLLREGPSTEKVASESKRYADMRCDILKEIAQQCGEEINAKIAGKNIGKIRQIVAVAEDKDKSKQRYCLSYCALESSLREMHNILNQITISSRGIDAIREHCRCIERSLNEYFTEEQEKKMREIDADGDQWCEICEVVNKAADQFLNFDINIQTNVIDEEVVFCRNAIDKAIGSFAVPYNELDSDSFLDRQVNGKFFGQDVSIYCNSLSPPLNNLNYSVYKVVNRFMVHVKNKGLYKNIAQNVRSCVEKISEEELILLEAQSGRIRACFLKTLPDVSLPSMDGDAVQTISDKIQSILNVAKDMYERQLNVSKLIDAIEDELDKNEDAVRLSIEYAKLDRDVEGLFKTIKSDKRAIDKLLKQIDMIQNVEYLVDYKVNLHTLLLELNLKKESLSKHINEFNELKNRIEFIEQNISQTLQKRDEVEIFLSATDVVWQCSEIFGDKVALFRSFDKLENKSLVKEFKNLRDHFQSEVCKDVRVANFLSSSMFRFGDACSYAKYMLVKCRKADKFVNVCGDDYFSALDITLEKLQKEHSNGEVAGEKSLKDISKSIGEKVLRKTRDEIEAKIADVDLLSLARFATDGWDGSEDLYSREHILKERFRMLCEYNNKIEGAWREIANILNKTGISDEDIDHLKFHCAKVEQLLVVEFNDDYACDENIKQINNAGDVCCEVFEILNQVVDLSSILDVEALDDADSDFYSDLTRIDARFYQYDDDDEEDEIWDPDLSSNLKRVLSMKKNTAELMLPDTAEKERACLARVMQTCDNSLDFSESCVGEIAHRRMEHMKNKEMYENFLQYINSTVAKQLKERTPYVEVVEFSPSFDSDYKLDLNL